MFKARFLNTIRQYLNPNEPGPESAPESQELVQAVNERMGKNSRRYLVTGLTGLTAGFLQACADSIMTGKNEKQNSRATDPEPVDPEEEEKANAIPDPENEEVIPPAGNCHPSKITTLEVDAPDAPEELRPAYVFYGQKSGTSMLAFQFATTRKIRAITLLSETKKLISYQTISSADIPEFEDIPYAPITIDNLFLNGFNHLVMLIKMDKDDPDDVKLYQFKIDFKYLTEFTGANGTQPVVDYSAANSVAKFLNAAGENIGQSVASFEEGGGFFEHPSILYPELPGAEGKRPLMVSTRSSMWTNSAKGIQPGTIVTDVMGRTLDINDPQLIIKHQTLVTYRASPDGLSYLRTMLRIG